MKMKKILPVVMAGALTVGCAFALTSCGGKSVKDGQTLVVGITDYAPMDYLENEEWTGFDAELAKKTFTDLGYKVEFKEIDWETKIVTLNTGKIDVIWNGMTVTDNLLDNLLLSNVYLQNQQYAVVKTENVSAYTKLSDIEGKTVSVESGSAADEALKDYADKATIRKPSSQSAAVMEVSTGVADIAIVDYTMALTLTSEGSDYYGTLSMVDLGFDLEEYAVAFRKADSRLCWNVNRKLTEYYKDGTIASLAEEYGLENLLVD